MHKISDIEKIYPNWYNKDSNLPYDEQLWIWEQLPLPEEDEQRLNTILKQEQNKNNESSINRSVRDTCKQQDNLTTNLSKTEANEKLKKCTYRTPPKEVAGYLECLFSDNPSKEGHWLYIAQHFNPRAINRTIVLMIKQQKTGERTIKNSSAYFTSLIKIRKQRRSMRR